MRSLIRVSVLALAVVGPLAFASAQPPADAQDRNSLPEVPETYGGPPPPAPPEPPPPPSVLVTRDFLLSTTVELVATPDSNLDEVLNAADYQDSPLVLGLDLQLRYRIWEFLWAGVRLNARTRFWDRTGRTPATAVAGVGQVVVGVRLNINRALDVGLAGGVGGGFVSLAVNSVGDTRGAFSAHLALEVGFTLSGPVRGIIKTGWDYLQAPINDFDHDLRFDGFWFAFGMEARL
ncbi:MAG: hypothetical protein AAGF12_25715 [Myxococcota bacterium]